MEKTYFIKRIFIWDYHNFILFGLYRNNLDRTEEVILLQSH